jgi:segregation and condensation protein A
VHTIVPYPYTVEGQKDFVLLELKRQGKRISFVEMLGQAAEKIAVIFNFLAILELLQNRLITLQLGEGFNNFWIEESPSLKIDKADSIVDKPQ